MGNCRVKNNERTGEKWGVRERHAEQLGAEGRTWKESEKK